MQFVLALDQGTTSSRAIVFDRAGAICAAAQREFQQYFPQPGWVEHDPEEIWSSQLAVAREALSRARIDAGQLAAVGIANQRETTIVWERASGRAICPAIVWQDRRTAPLCDQLRAAGHEPSVQRRTGLLFDPYFSATKLAWILENVAGARERAQRGELAFGTVDSWLVWKLTGARAHLTDATNASRTGLYNIHSLAWDDELLRLYGVPHAMLPRVVASSGMLAKADPAWFGGAVPIAGIAGDQQAALFGQRCSTPGLVKNTYGTGCFILMHTGEHPIESRHRLLTTIALHTAAGTQFALEGGVFVGGAVVQWLRDGLGVVESSAQVEALARSVPDNGGVYLVPALAGLGAPHWDPYARGAVFGLTRGATRGHLARAALESIAFQSADLLDAMAADASIAIRELRVDGGAAANDLLLQFQADLIGVPVIRPQITETTALGAAYLAGLGVGLWPDAGALDAQWREQRRFEPTMPRDQARGLMAQWRRAVERVKGWAVQ
jgi:glycerol kinase